ncbi:helix-turn-helix transcriptional regulator [Saccharopolyspora shandongensis]|uniref:helix-turn-helix transcriptional regulator n=1 Tax=Saccharopolyspora shandongensis TaxID=418495 RepID=UPI0033F2DF29
MIEFMPVANGVSTDHPMPHLPFVDDTHIPVTDPEAIEKLGRHPDTDMWGRCDRSMQAADEWIAFTTDPKNHDYAWVVRHHPDHGHSVLLYRDQHAASVHHEWFSDRRLFLTRAGGYWWDGHDWYRPRQVLDWSQEGYAYRSVRQPTTITAEDMLDSSCKPALGEIYKVAHFQPQELDAEQWRHDLALWSARRRARDSGVGLDRCVVTLNAPELAERTMLTIDQFAERAGIAASTLRAYIARDEADVPLPQSTVGGRKRWSVPVVDDWIEERKRDPWEVGSVLTGDQESSLAPALRDSWRRMTKAIRSTLDRPPRKLLRRGADPERFAADLGWTAALTADQDRLRGEALALTVEKAVLWELASRVKLYSDDPEARQRGYGMAIAIGKMLGWFIRTDPRLAPQVFGAIVREAEQDLGIPPQVTGKSIRDAIWFDGGLPEDEKARVDDFVKVTLPPDAK